MPKNDKPTAKQHYIPQFYLKQFSADGKRVYQYNIQSDCKSTFVPITSICFEKNLYEFQNDSKKPVQINSIENKLAKYEAIFSETIKSIKSKTSNKENFYTRCFLSENEKASLIFFLTIQILRTPEILNMAQETALKCFKGISNSTAYNVALNTCLPVYKKLSLDEKNIFNTIIRSFENMSFQIGITSYNSRIITSDRPVILYGDCKLFKYDEAIFPLSSKILLCMKRLEETDHGYRNRLIPLKSDYIEYVNKQIAAHCKEWIYSEKELTNVQIKWIEGTKRG